MGMTSGQYEQTRPARGAVYVTVWEGVYKQRPNKARLPGERRSEVVDVIF